MSTSGVTAYLVGVSEWLLRHHKRTLKPNSRLPLLPALCAVTLLTSTITLAAAATAQDSLEGSALRRVARQASEPELDSTASEPESEPEKTEEDGGSPVSLSAILVRMIF